MREIYFVEAIREAILAEMEKDPNIFVEGEDVSWGGSYGEYLGFKEKFPDRMFDTPITETAITGLGLGSAVMGLRPIVEYSLADFMLVPMDEIVNQVAKFRYMNGGKPTIPMVLHASCGATVSAAAQHSQCLEALFAHIPGLKIVIPSNPADAKGLMHAAIRDDNPVIYIQHLRLLNEKGDVPEGEYVVPLGKASIAREGKDVTLISYGGIIPYALQAADMLATDGINAEVVDLRSLVPLDKETILSSVEKTHRVVIAHEAVKNSGFGSEVAAVIAEEGFDLLDAPIKRLGAPFCPVPFSPVLEKAYVVSPEDICQAAKELF